VRKEHEAGVRRQAKLLRELGVPDLSPEEVTEKSPPGRARRREQQWLIGRAWRTAPVPVG